MSYSFDKFFIDGSWCEPTQERRIELVNPATKSVFATVPEAAPADVEAAVVAAAAAQPEWAAVKLQERADLMQRMLDVFKTHREAIIELEAQELGAPVSFGASAHCDYQFVRIQSYIDIARGMALEERFAKSTVLRGASGGGGLCHAMELPARAGGSEGCSRSAHGQYRGAQAQPAYAIDVLPDDGCI